MAFSTDMLPEKTRKMVEQSCIDYACRGFYGDNKEKIKAILNNPQHELHEDLVYKFMRITQIEIEIQELIQDE